VAVRATAATGLALLALTGPALVARLPELAPRLGHTSLGASGVLGILALTALGLSPRLLPLAVGLGVAALPLRRRPELAPGAWEIAGFSLAAAVLGLGLSLAVAPWAARAREARLAEARLDPGWAALAPGAVVRVAGWRLAADAVDSAGRRLEGVVLGPPGARDALFARRARLDPLAESGEILVTLEDGAVLASDATSDATGGERERFALRQFRLPSGRSDAAASPAAVEGMSWRALGAWARGSRAGSAGEGARATRERLRRLAAPLAAVPFGLLGLAALAARRRRARRAGDPRRTATASRPAQPPARLRPRSHVLGRRIAARFALLALGSLAALLAAGVAVDVATHLSWLGSHAADGCAWVRFALLRAPWVAAELLPPALGVAGALLGIGLAKEGSLVGMRASGIPDVRIALPALAVAAFVAPLPVLLRGWEPSAGSPGSEQTREWRRAGPWLFEAESFDRSGATARGVTLYRVDDEGLPVRRIDAPLGRHVGGGVWRLEGPPPREGDAASRLVALGPAPWSAVDARGLGTGDLVASIAALEEGEFDAGLQRAALHARLAGMLACLALPALTLLLALEGGWACSRPRAALVAGGLGALWLASASLSSRVAALAPVASGWAPAIALSAAAGWLARRALRRAR